jgi:hypothetical protein
MTNVPASPLWSWIPASLPRIALSARLSRKSRPTDRYDRHLPLPVTTPLLNQLPRPTCRTRTDTHRTPRLPDTFPIQAP